MSGTFEGEAKIIADQVAAAVLKVRALDYDSIADVFTPTGRVMIPGRPMAAGRAAVRQAWAEFLGSMSELEVDYGPREIEIGASGETAMEVGWYALSMATPEGRIADRGKYIVVWKKIEGAWLIEADILNSDLAAPEPVAAAA